MAAIWVPVWTLIFSRGTQLNTNMGPLGWHAHEMVFGYTGAVLAGFLLTAARNWTKRATLSGAPLAALMLLWVIGRVAALHSASLPHLMPPMVDGLFYAVLAVALARPIALAKSKRNVIFPILIAVIGACDVAVHLHTLGYLPMWSTRALGLAMDSIIVILIVFAARVIPMFTRNATKKPVRARGALDHLGAASVIAYLVLNALLPGHTAAYGAALTAGAINVSRLWGWGTSRTFRQPILWVLHLGWFLLTAGLIMRGIAGLFPFAAPSAWTHLIAVGGIGVLTLGMMSRVALGHTGRPLVAAPSVAFAFVLLLLAVGTRVAASVLHPAQPSALLWTAAIAWAGAFSAFALRYAPILLRKRADGKPG